MEQTLQQIDIAQLRQSPFNPRTEFDKEALAELTASIKEKGVLEPLLVRPSLKSDLFEIIAGERRFRAAANAGLEAVPCVVRAATDEEAREIQIVENLQRKGIGPLEEAQGFQDLLKLHNSKLTNILAGEKPDQLTPADLAKKIGKSKEYVHHRLALLRLAPPAKKALAAQKITPGHAQELVALPPIQQDEMLKFVDGCGFGSTPSVQGLRQEIKYRFAPKPQPSAREKAERAKQKKKFKEDQARWDRERKKSVEKRAAQEKLDAIVRPRIVAQLAAKVKRLSPEDEEGLAGMLWDSGNVDEWIAPLLTKTRGNKPARITSRAAFRTWFRVAKPSTRAVVIVAMQCAEYGAKPEAIAKRHGVDVAAIERQARKEIAAAAKPAAKAGQPTSAKAKKGAGRGKAKGEKG